MPKKKCFGSTVIASLTARLEFAFLLLECDATLPVVSLTDLQQQIAQSERELQTLSQELESKQNHLTELTRRKGALQSQLRQAQEVLDYARQCKRQRPKITDEELRAFLQAKFIKNIDPLAEALARGVVVGAIDNPLDWLWGLSSILREINRLWNSSGADVGGNRDIIDGIVIIVSDEPATA
jgi:hypothetical protein